MASPNDLARICSSIVRNNKPELLILGISAAYIGQTYSLPFDSILFPYVLIAAMVILLVLGATTRAPGEAVEDSAEPGQAEHSEASGIPPAGYVVIVSTFVFTLIAPYLGFFISLSLYLGTLFTYFRSFDRRIAPLVGVGIALLVTLVLGRELGFALPAFRYLDLPLNL